MMQMPRGTATRPNPLFAPGGHDLAIAGADGLRLWSIDDKGPRRGELIERQPYVAGWMDIVFDTDGKVP